MSILYENDVGFYISHKKYIDGIYRNIQRNGAESIHLKNDLFEIFSPYKVMKNSSKVSKPENAAESEINADSKLVQQNYATLKNDLQVNEVLIDAASNEPNTAALKSAETIYSQSGLHLVDNAIGSNNGPAILKRIGQANFIFPENSKFFCKDVLEMDKHLHGHKYDLILLDPPWWNKYIRRKRKKSPHAYNMMFNEDLKKIPVENLLNDDGLVAVWCTNSLAHLSTLENDIFPKWRVKAISKWYWLKVTKSGQTVCDFSKHLGKQPFEQIIFASRNTKEGTANPPDRKLVVSVPSAIHSHKPPLVELLAPYLPENPNCLEVFARYLLPFWTSYGNEALRLQHESVYM